ncbi:hypothetical protein EcWSU1_03918 [Enterobacter ludwigii]|uniref:Uncharacterized protein n=1 Tax=Enterobacter ludwigii TaxID=299767 RepID=G8LFH8_9ENTR|nr:hypothetical protein EcWSU1_03918 [Enterobacter ludwigii]
MCSFSIACLPLLIQNAVDAVCAWASDGQQQEATRDGQVFHEHQRVHAFRKVTVEDERRQQGEACGKQCSGAGQEAEQNRQAAAELKENSQWQQEPGNTHGFHVLLRARITGDFAPACGDKQNRHQNTRYQNTNIF